MKVVDEEKGLAVVETTDGKVPVELMKEGESEWNNINNNNRNKSNINSNNKHLFDQIGLACIGEELDHGVIQRVQQSAPVSLLPFERLQPLKRLLWCYGG